MKLVNCTLLIVMFAISSTAQEEGIIDVDATVDDIVVEEAVQVYPDTAIRSLHAISKSIGQEIDVELLNDRGLREEAFTKLEGDVEDVRQRMVYFHNAMMKTLGNLKSHGFTLNERALRHSDKKVYVPQLNNVLQDSVRINNKLRDYERTKVDLANARRTLADNLDELDRRDRMIALLQQNAQKYRNAIAGLRNNNRVVNEQVADLRVQLGDGDDTEDVN